VIKDVFLPAGGPANLIHLCRTGPAHRTFKSNVDSDLSPSDAGVRAPPGHHVDAIPHGASSRAALSLNHDEVLRVTGFVELTARNCELFRSETSAALNGHSSIEIDLSQTTVMDCAGLGALIALRNCARRRRGVLRLVNPAPAVRRLFDIVRAEQMFEIVNREG
jgi:anti-anti-sigma factor